MSHSCTVVPKFLSLSLFCLYLQGFMYEVRGFPFTLFYRPEGDGVVIFAVSHHARRPGYWTDRTRDRY